MPKHSSGNWRVATAYGGVEVTSSEPGLLEGSKRIADCTNDLKSQGEVLANAYLIAAGPKMQQACDAADTAFAVLNVSDLTPQARSCVRQAWPLVQDALAAANPNGAFAEAVKEAHQHEIARLDALVLELSETLRIIANQSWTDEKEKLELADFMRQHARDAIRSPEMKARIAATVSRQPILRPKLAVITDGGLVEKVVSDHPEFFHNVDIVVVNESFGHEDDAKEISYLNPVRIPQKVKALVTKEEVFPTDIDLSTL